MAVYFSKAVRRLIMLAALLCSFAPNVRAENEIPAEAKAAVERGLRAFSKGDLQAARNALKESLKLAPDNPTGLVNLGIVEFRLGNSDIALPLLQKAVRQNPDAAPAWLTLGMLHFQRQRLDEALAALSQAVVLEPENARAHNYLAVTIGSKGWKDGAEAELQKAVSLDPDYGDAHFNLAVFYLERMPPAVELARRHYQRALDLGQRPDPLVEKALNSAKD